MSEVHVRSRRHANVGAAGRKAGGWVGKKEEKEKEGAP